MKNRSHFAFFSAGVFLLFAGCTQAPSGAIATLRKSQGSTGSNIVVTLTKEAMESADRSNVEIFMKVGIYRSNMLDAQCLTKKGEIDYQPTDENRRALLRHGWVPLKDLATMQYQLTRDHLRLGLNEEQYIFECQVPSNEVLHLVVQFTREPSHLFDDEEDLDSVTVPLM